MTTHAALSTPHDDPRDNALDLAMEAFKQMEALFAAIQECAARDEAPIAAVRLTRIRHLARLGLFHAVDRTDLIDNQRRGWA